MMDFNTYRDNYDSMSPANVVEYHRAIYERAPVQRRFNAPFMLSELESLGTIGVAELGGWDGELAKAALEANPSNIVSWVNYEVCPQVVANPVVTDERYKVELCDDAWAWEIAGRADVLVSSHSIEHVRLDQFVALVDKVAPDSILVTAPLTTRRNDWRNYRGTHVMTASWDDVDRTMKMMGYDTLVATDRNRHYRRQ